MSERAAGDFFVRAGAEKEVLGDQNLSQSLSTRLQF
jgi:hypothetical protein